MLILPLFFPLCQETGRSVKWGALDEYPVNFSFITALEKLNSNLFISSTNLESIINKKTNVTFLAYPILYSLYYG